MILNQGARDPLRGLIKLPSELKDYLKLLCKTKQVLKQAKNQDVRLYVYCNLFPQQLPVIFKNQDSHSLGKPGYLRKF